MPVTRRFFLIAGLWASALGPTRAVGPQSPPPATRASTDLVRAYTSQYFRMYPSRATQAGAQAFDSLLEFPTLATRERWLRYNRQTVARVATLIPESPSSGVRLDLEAVERQAAREVFEYAVRRRPERDPLFWSTMVAEAGVFLLIRNDRPLASRMAAARARTRQLPRLVAEARRSLALAQGQDVVPEFAQLAARQMKASATFYRDGMPQAANALGSVVVSAVQAEGRRTALSLDAFAAFLDSLATRATGSPRLGADYPAVFAAGTGITAPIDSVLAGAERDLDLTRHEAAVYARQHWASLLPNEPLPADDRAVVARAFALVAAARDTSVQEYLAYWRTLPLELERFVRAHDITTLPEPRTLLVDIAPNFFVGQSVGGVYPAGPFSPEGTTILYVPVPGDEATREQADVFFRDFNRPFTTMIAAHELMPGHYAQLKHAARHAHVARAVFADEVFTEGWGTFCERVMLDAGWGGALEFLAHYKKQMENVARTIVDIRVHTRDMSRDEMIRFVRQDALQGEQLAANMWNRTLTTAPQITTYYLGYRQIRDLYRELQARDGAHFSQRAFMDAMVSLGSVPVPAIRRELLGQPGAPVEKR